MKNKRRHVANFRTYRSVIFEVLTVNSRPTSLGIINFSWDELQVITHAYEIRT